MVILAAQYYGKVTNPTFGVKWVQGSDKNITWSLNGYAGPMHLILFQNGNRVGRIAANLSAGTQHFPWKVGKLENRTAPVGRGYSIRVKLLDAAVSLKSPDFEIVAQYSAPGINRIQNPHLVTPQLDPKFRPKQPTIEGIQFPQQKLSLIHI